MGNRACLAVNDVGKPCAGEPHARFERGPLEKRERTRRARNPRASARYQPHPTTQRPTSQLGSPSRFNNERAWEIADISALRAQVAGG